MNRSYLLIVLVLIVCGSCGSMQMAHAAVAKQSGAQTAGAAMPLGQAVAKAEARTGGRVLAAGKATLHGEPVYRIKVLTPQGRVQTLIMDARTGKWLR